MPGGTVAIMGTPIFGSDTTRIRMMKRQSEDQLGGMTMIRRDQEQQLSISLIGGVVLAAGALLAATPSTSIAQYWDYNYYRGAYGPMSHGWYYDYYEYEPSGFGTPE